MFARIVLTTALLFSAFSASVAQTVRFETNVGEFDMVLNPTGDPNLQPLVDNLVAYVGLGRYHFMAINRAADGVAGDPSDDFVLQMGSFLGFPPIPDLFADLLVPIERFDPVEVDSDGDGQVDFDTADLMNERGTVSLALSAGNPNSGTSSFFINLQDNADLLDPQGFVPFATIEDMTTVDLIMELMQTDLSDEVGSPGNLAFVDVPLLENGRLVVVTDLTVIADDDFSFVGPINTALQITSGGPISGGGSATLVSSALSEEPSLAVASTLEPAALSVVGTPVPEPSTLAMVLAAALAAGFLRARNSAD